VRRLFAAVDRMNRAQKVVVVAGCDLALFFVAHGLTSPSVSIPDTAFVSGDRPVLYGTFDTSPPFALFCLVVWLVVLVVATALSVRLLRYWNGPPEG